MQTETCVRDHTNMKRDFLIEGKICFLIIFVLSFTGFCYGWEILTNEFAPYSFEEANWRTGNYIQSCMNSDYNFLTLSENWMGSEKIPSRLPYNAYGCDTGRALTCFSEEAIFTPVVRLELIKKMVQGLDASKYPGTSVIYFPWNATKRQITALRPCAAVTQEYPASRMMAQNVPDTRAENLAVVWPRVKSDGNWYSDANYAYSDIQDNIYNTQEGLYATKRNYTSPTLPAVTICGKGWDGDKDRLQEIVIESDANNRRESLQLVFSDFASAKMGFSAPYPTALPDTIQLPDKREISKSQWSVSSPAYNYLIIYAKDANCTAFGYQNAMLFIWEKTPLSVTVDWSEGAFRNLYLEYGGKEKISAKVWIGRFQGVDPSADLGFIHYFAGNVLKTGQCGFEKYNPFETCWAEEPVGGVCAGAYILCKYDAEEDNFGGDYADAARQLATKLVDDRIAMWRRNRCKSDYYATFMTYQFVAAADYLSMLYDLPGRFNDPAKKDYYLKWMCRWADQIVVKKYTDGRNLTAIWRAYERSNDVRYKKYFEQVRGLYKFSATDGIYFNNAWLPVRQQYDNGDVLGAIGRRGEMQDKADIENVLTFITNQSRWADNGYLGMWWEVTGDASITCWGEWSNALGMKDAPKKIVGIREFPVYYRKGNEVVVEITNTPSLYNPKYWDQEVMKNYLPLLPHKLCKSIIFRIDNVFLRNDYYQNWWKGVTDPNIISDLNAIKANVQKVLNYIDTDTIPANYNDIMNLLGQCDSLYESAMNKLNNPVNVDHIAGMDNLASHLGECINNHIYLKNILTKNNLSK